MRFPLPLRYKTTPKHGTLPGFGQAGTISSQNIIFAPGDGLKQGMEAKIAAAWPFLLDGHIYLQLVFAAAITSSEDGLTEARILTYDFRTRRLPLVSDIGAVGSLHWADFPLSPVTGL